MGYGHDKKSISEADAQSAMQPISTPLPKQPVAEPAVDVATDRAPTPEEVLDPRRPSMRGVDSSVLVDSLSALVDDIYQNVFERALDAMKPQLAEVPTPQKDDEWVWKLLSGVVEAIATATLGQVGGIAARSLGTAVPALGKAASDASSTLSKVGGKAVGEWTEGRLKQDAARSSEPTLEGPVSATGKLVDDFVDREHNVLLAKKHDALNVLRVIKASATKQNPEELEDVDIQLRSALERGNLQQWFQRKVAMEWANFLARLSLGPRPQAQATNMVGANMIGGWHEAGAAGIAQWRGGHDGFVEITVNVKSGAPVLAAAQVENRPGVAAIIEHMGKPIAPGEATYNLATVPMFRRVWLKTGTSKLESSPAFVLTPEGALEVNYDDPLLASLGGAALPPRASAYDALPDPQRNATAWSERSNRAAHALAGAHRIVTTVLSNPSDMSLLK